MALETGAWFDGVLLCPQEIGVKKVAELVGNCRVKVAGKNSTITRVEPVGMVTEFVWTHAL